MSFRQFIAVFERLPDLQRIPPDEELEIIDGVQKQRVGQLPEDVDVAVGVARPARERTAQPGRRIRDRLLQRARHRICEREAD